jgi:hypothetical protein
MTFATAIRPTTTRPAEAMKMPPSSTKPVSTSKFVGHIGVPRGGAPPPRYPPYRENAARFTPQHPSDRSSVAERITVAFAKPVLSAHGIFIDLCSQFNRYVRFMQCQSLSALRLCSDSHNRLTTNPTSQTQKHAYPNVISFEVDSTFCNTPAVQRPNPNNVLIANAVTNFAGKLNFRDGSPMQCLP